MKIWNTEGYDQKVLSYLFYKSHKLVTKKDYAELQGVFVKRHRNPLEPVTYDFLYEDCPSIYEKSQKLMQTANNKFGFHLDRWQQPLRFNEYSVGQKFSWHCDYATKDNSKLAFVHIIKKAEQGGEFRIMCDEKIVSFDLNDGETLVFPAYLQHTVTEIEKGTRLALVGWATGKQFR